MTRKMPTNYTNMTQNRPGTLVKILKIRRQNGTATKMSINQMIIHRLDKTAPTTGRTQKKKKKDGDGG
jgi:hypothetical protein